MTQVEYGNDFQPIGPASQDIQGLSGPYGIVLTNGSQTVGAVRISFDPNSDLFIIQELTDDICQPVTGGGIPGVTVPDNGGVAIPLKNFDATLHLQSHATAGPQVQAELRAI